MSADTAAGHAGPGARASTYGIAAMLGTTIVVPMMGMSVKLLAAEGLGAIATMGLRSTGVLLMLLPFLTLGVHRRAIIAADRKAHFWHAFFGLSSMACFYYGLAFLPLVIVTAINFTTPIFVMLIAIPLLSERPDWRAFLAAGVGFAGTLLALGPMEGVGSAALIILLGAFMTGCMIIAIRKMPPKSTHFAVLFYYAALGTAIFGPLALLTASPEEWASLAAARTWALIAMISVLACLLQFLLTIAYRLSRSASVAALDYLRIIWAAGIGWVIFGEWPTLTSLAGMALIVGSGIALILLQRKAPEKRAVTAVK